MTMNDLILAHAGREDGDKPQSVKPNGMSKIVLDALPKDEHHIFKKREE